jgi:hypothetical protein
MIEGLAALIALRSELDDAIAQTVHGLRSPKWAYSWADIARVLGTTRQAAQQRYGHSPVCSNDVSIPNSVGSCCSNSLY